MRIGWPAVHTIIIAHLHLQTPLCVLTFAFINILISKQNDLHINVCVVSCSQFDSCHAMIAHVLMTCTSAKS